MKLILAALVSGLIVWAVMSHQHKSAPIVQVDQQKERLPTLNEQQECSAAVERQVIQGGWTEKDNASVVSHYSTKLGHCYGMLSALTTQNHEIWIDRYVFDGVEGTEIGSGTWKHSEWAEGKLTCSIDTPDGDTKRCGDVPEFEGLASTLYGLSR